MSLDVYLTLHERPATPPLAVSGPVGRIFVRQGGATVELTRAEWDELYPGREPVVMVSEPDPREVFSANITHNLGKMAAEVGLYEALWRPDEIGIEHASQLIEPLKAGLVKLWNDEVRLLQFNPKNGWGNYELLVKFCKDYLVACEKWPEAEVRAWR